MNAAAGRWLHTVIGLLLACAAASLLPTVLLLGMDDVEIEGADGWENFRDFLRTAPRLYALVWCGALLSALLPFAVVWRLALKQRRYGWKFYVLAGLIAPYAMALAAFCVGLILRTLNAPDIDRGLATSYVMAGFFLGFICGPLGGWVFWLYARRFPPLVEWRREAEESAPRNG